MAHIELKGIHKYYGKVHVLKDINLTIEDGDFMTLLGPSGCGKTTTLRVLSGLECPQNGTIHIDGEEFVNAQTLHFEPASKRRLNLVFQSYALWPHMTVAQNVYFGLNVKKLPAEKVKSMTESALDRMQILTFKDRYPSELSGGQQQRVAIARAIASNPNILLLDEPLSNLDAKLRIEMRSVLKRLHRELGTTIVYVTHDQAEALTMSTKIAVFCQGELAQVAPPMELYNNPASLFVADFIGNPRLTFIKADCVYDGNTLKVCSPLGSSIFQADELEAGNLVEGGFEGIIAVRPEHVILHRLPGEGRIPAKVYSGMPAGSETLVQVTVQNVELMAKMISQEYYEYDEDVYIEINPSKVNVYHAKSGLLVKRIGNRRASRDITCEQSNKDQ